MIDRPGFAMATIELVPREGTVSWQVKLNFDAAGLDAALDEARRRGA
jgi:hypothetical protein